MPQLALWLLACVFVVLLGWLFVNLSQPGKRTVPVLVMAASLLAAVLLFRVFGFLAVLTGVIGVCAGFLMGVFAKGSSGGSSGSSGRGSHLH